MAKKKEKKNSEDYEKLKTWYEEEIKRRDKIIDQLRKENFLIMDAAIKNREKDVKFQK
jgi:hypothetical protein